MGERSGWRRQLGPALLVGLLAFLLTVDLRAQHVASRSTASGRAELVRIAALRERREAELERRLAALRAQLNAALARSGAASLRALADQTAALSATAGATEVHGPGVVVRLADASGATASNADARIQDVDVAAVVNALWEAGAEAIAVNGQRVVSTTAIRNAGNAVLVNFRVLSSPYDIAAVGAPAMKDRLGASETAKRFKNWSTIYGLGFGVRSERDIVLPGSGGGARLRYATPIG
jgi:uncharacterized protein YlxW (UPF0749 family)